ncbi:MAG TPA: leucyl aminopeptidase [Devosia sp.]|nr:leucyl aminopeptidase [Devosia sp.]
MSPHLDIKTSKLPTKKTGIIVVYAGQGDILHGHAADLWKKTGLDWKKITASAGFEGKQKQMFSLVAPPNLPCDRLLVLGIEAPADDHAKPASLVGWAARGGALLSALESLRCEKAAIILDDQETGPEKIAEFAAGLRLRRYSFDKYKTARKNGKKPKPEKKLTITLHVADKPATDKALAERMARVEGTLLARDLVNEPPNVLGPREFADVAVSLKEHGVEVEILNARQMEKLGMGSLLCVAQGSEKPALMAIMQWKGGKKTQKPVAFVGKGVCFDTGGISIKPSNSMEEMKGDMGGAAAVVGLMKSLALRKCPRNVVGVIGLVENMPDGKATRPGDIVTAMSGTTIEIINTDAEGRLVLADALWYTQDRFKPEIMINLATLTGAILIALGRDYAGLFSNNDELATKLYEAGIASGEKVWRLPLGPAYDKLIESRFADIKNTGGRLAGSITAAQFLERFVNNVPWAHLDIAATGFGAPGSDISKSWASGFGVALLDQLLRDNYET